MLQVKNVLIGVCFTFLLFFGIPIQIEDNTSPEMEFAEFIKKYNKNYENDTMYKLRLQAFKESLQTINKLNSMRDSNYSAKYGLTNYSDIFPHEFTSIFLQPDMTQRKKKFKQVGNRSTVTKLPSKVDWRTKGYISEVNNQKGCGACWAFSVIETVETMNAIKTGNLTKLSTQQIIDCAENNNDGCNGGDMCLLLEWLTKSNVSIANDNEYPLHLRNEACKTDIVNKNGVRIKDYLCYDLTNNEDLMLHLLVKGPIAVSINALSWQNYLGGIIQFHCDQHPLLLNHAVQIVGYNLDAKVPYYIVRNSWGEQFGDNGYLYIQTGKNLCGIAHEVAAVTIY